VEDEATMSANNTGEATMKDTDLVALMASMFAAGTIAMREGYAEQDEKWALDRAQEMLLRSRRELRPAPPAREDGER
jgi:hypothetical protein